MNLTTVQDYLVESIKQTDNMYRNIINAIHPYPCGICQKNVNKNQKAILCTNCSNWIHIKCNGTSDTEYNQIMDNNDVLSEEEIDKIEWFCNKCRILKTAQIFPFGLEDDKEVQNIMHSDSMKALENLPSYDIVSKAENFESVMQSDIDENIINNLNSRYYSAHEFQSLGKNNMFTIFH